MTTTQLVIVCATVLIIAALVLRDRAARVERDYHLKLMLAQQDRAIAGQYEQLAQATVAVVEVAEHLDVELGPTRVGRRVTVNTCKPDDQTIHGLVVGDWPSVLRLEAASYVSPNGSTAIPGQVDIDRKRISWTEVLDDGEA